MLVSIQNKLKNFKKIRVYILMLMFISPLSASHNFIINMNDEDLETGLKFDLGQFAHSLPINSYFLDMNYLYMEDDNGDTNTQSEFGIIMKNKLQNIQEITVGLGVKNLYTKKYGKSFISIPLGITVDINFPIRGLPISLSGSFYYAPKPLTFKDGEKYLEQRFELGFEVIKRGVVYIGYREIQTHFHIVEDDYILNKTPFVGFKLGF